ncbi:MAG: hypothetical protein L0287_09375 [Anaerolineae bacterium]|nr:hypothetical protein [Anaerolineae bacterium]
MITSPKSIVGYDEEVDDDGVIPGFAGDEEDDDTEAEEWGDDGDEDEDDDDGATEDEVWSDESREL